MCEFYLFFHPGLKLVTFSVELEQFAGVLQADPSFLEKHGRKSSSERHKHTQIRASDKVRAPDKVRIFISKMPISSLNPMFDHLLESSHRDDSNKWSNIGFGKEIKYLESVEVHFTHLIWCSEPQ